MCPSYMVTREEEHTTRGRARILFEMLEGETITDGFRSQEVHDALDLCLACNGCKGDCPVNVDIGIRAEQALLERMGADVEILDSGCCGMAASFGFEREHYEHLDAPSTNLRRCCAPHPRAP